MERELLTQLLSHTSVSGDEFGIQQLLKEHMIEFADNYENDEIGDGIFTIEGNNGRKVLMTSHIDEIGLFVTGATEDGFIKVTNAGGIIPRIFPGHGVVISTKNGDIYGSVVLYTESLKKSEFKVSEIRIDIGAKTKEEALKAVDLGDTVTFDVVSRELLNGRFMARGLDDKCGVYVIMEVLKRVHASKKNTVSVTAAATVGEETSKHGARWVANRTDPTEAIVVDVTYTSDYEGFQDAEWGEVKLGGGPVLCINPICDKEINKRLMRLAEERGIPYQIEVSGGRSCTDADEIHVSNRGVPVVLASIPLRYMHSPAEVLDFKDLEYTIELLEAYLEQM